MENMETKKTNKSKHKPHYCIFCKTEIKRIYEHFNRKHKNEDKVRQIIAMQDKKKRYWMWKQLTQQGDHYFNSQTDGSLGKLKLVKSPPSESTKKKYYNCDYCLGRIRRTSKYTHLKMCSKHLKKPVLDEELDFLAGVPEILINVLRNSIYMIDFFKDISQVKDKRIIRTYISDISTLEKELQQYIGAQRPLALLFVPENVVKVIAVIKKLSGEEKLGTEVVMRYPFKAKRLCQLIEALADFLIVHFSKKNMDTDMLTISKFLNIFKRDSFKILRKNACNSVKLKKLRNPNKLPKTSDIKKLVDILKKESNTLLQELNLNQNPATWRKLAENTLLRITIYNRRRGGCIEKLSVDDFKRSEIKSKVATEEALYGLNDEDKEFLNNLRVVEIIHKHDNVVPILLTKEMNDIIEMLTKYRSQANINKENPYVFAAGKNSLNPIKCNKIMEKYREHFPEGIRELFTATNLRKHGATTAQVLDLTPQDRQEWAYHMGHTLAVHDKYYRNPEQVSAVLKTGRILNALNDGSLKYYKGKKIKDISFKSITGSQIEEDCKAKKKA